MALYISLFPQLIAGPIVRYHDIANQLIKRTFTMQKFGNGVERFIIGLGKKVLLANNFALVADNIFGMSYVNISTPEAWLGIIAYSFQIYFDFAGYSDMAIGLGKMFGFTFLENFNFPYISKSIKEFWRRWHISLSTWFRDYLYIPLGGNRVAYYRIYINLMIVFVLTGFWHGASWSFLFWGIFHGFFLIIEKLGIDRVLTKLWAPLQHAYALFVVIIGWVFFRVETIQQAFLFVKKMFIPTQSTNTIYSYFDIQFICVTIVAILGAFGFFPWIANHIKPYISKSKLLLILFSNLYIIVLISIFILTIFYLMSGSYNPFIYFRF